MSANLFDPYPHAALVTKSDTVDLPVKANALWLGNFSGAAATITVTTVGGEMVLITLGSPPTSAFFILPIQVSRVWSTGTTASLGTIVALWH